MEISKKLIIAFSGCSHTGKTTATKRMIEYFGEENVVLHDEIVRREIDNIDEIRKDPTKYLDLQIKVISEKIEQERAAAKSDEKKIFLFDRAITDSLFYYTFYLDHNNLSENDFHKYVNNLNYILDYLQEQVEYDMVVNFSLFDGDIPTDDPLRPSELNRLKFIEDFMIRSYNQTRFGPKLFPYHAQKDHLDTIIFEIEEML